MAEATLKMLLLGEDRSASKALKGVGQEATATEKHTSRMGSTFSRVGKIAAIGLAGGIAGGALAAKKFAEAAIEDQQSAALMAKAFHNSAGATNEQVAATEKWISKQGVAKGVADDELRPALTKLISATHDVGKAQKLASLAMDVSAGSGKSLETVSSALMKAQNGNVGALGKLGIKVKDSVKDMDGLRRAQISLKQAQLNYTKAVKEHGSTSAEAKIAADKVSAAQFKLGEAQTKAKQQTIGFDEAVSRMSKTFSGAATTKADTLQGKIDRLKLMMSEAGEAIGYKLIPALTKMGDWILKTGIPAVSSFGAWVKKNSDWIKPLVIVLGTAVVALIAVAKVIKLVTAAQAMLNLVLDANPIGLIILAIAALVVGLIYAYRHSAKFRDIVNGAFTAIKKVAGPVLTWLAGAVKDTVTFVKNHWKLILGILTGPIGAAALFIITHFGSIKTAATSVVTWVKGIPGKLADLAKSFGRAGGSLIGAFVDGMKNAGGVISGIAGNVWKAVKHLLNEAIDKINSALSFTISLPGPDLSVNVPNIPHLAVGTQFFPGGIARVGERGPETVFMPRGSSVAPNGARAAGGGSNDIHVTAPLVLKLEKRVVWQGLLELKRERGGVTLGLA